jgi:mono/diheme cytochrome c family protein
MPEIPDMTKGSWQQRRSDAQLLASILDGKGDDMPPMGRKLGKKQARRLVAYVRAFAPTAKKPRQRTKAAATRDSFEERFRRLEEQLNKLNRQARELSDVSSRTSSKPSPSRQRPNPGRTTPTAARAPALRKLFQQHCVKCHGADGKGRPARRLMPEIPNFTKGSWQRRRSDAQLLASILDGKGDDMPPMGRKLGKKQARRLVAYVRAFAPTAKKPRQRNKAAASRDSFED